MKIYLAIAMLYILTNATVAITKKKSFEIDQNLQLFQNYVDLDMQLRDFTEKAVKRIIPFVLEASEHVNISTTCMDNMFHFMTGLRKLTEWSLRFLDATGKPPSGIMKGNIQMFGEYNQCFDTVVKKKDKIHFRGQYCTIIINPVLPNTTHQYEVLKDIMQNSTGLMKYLISKLYIFYPMEPRLGVCIPSGCTKNDFSQMLNYISQNVFINTTVSFCIKNEDLYYWTNEKIVAACVFAFLGILLVICTILDNTLEEWKKNTSGLAPRIIESFSITHNFPKLINTDTSEETVTCFYGIRVLSVFWIVLCHEYVLQATGLTSSHAMNIEDLLNNVFSQIVLNGFTATEIFFFLAGFVNCYSRVKLHKKGKKQPNFFQILIHRLWRIYPTLIVGFLTFLLLQHSSAPYHEAQTTISKICKKYWWQNFLFISNFYRPLNVCLPHTWYLCVDMQIFLLSLITIPVLLRNEKIGICLHIGVIFLANIGCFMLWWILDLPPSPAVFPIQSVSEFNVSYFEYQARIYMLPLPHIASYYIGIMIGYVAASKEKKKFSKVITVLGWLTASVLYVTVIFITYQWRFNNNYTKLESSFYGSFSKSTLVLCASWMVYVCLTGQARFINYILSLKIWIPLSRLTFMLYMVSILVQTYYNSNLNFPPDFANIPLIWSYFGNLSISMLLSLALVLVAESPFLSLEKIIFRRNVSASNSTPEMHKGSALNGNIVNGIKEKNNIMTVHL